MRFSQTRLIAGQLVASLFIAGIHDAAPALVYVVTGGVRDHTPLLLLANLSRVFTKMHQGGMQSRARIYHRLVPLGPIPLVGLLTL